MRILVADDDTLFLKVASEILSEAGYEVTLATDGKDAIRKAVTHHPDLIILDIVLPKMLGTEVCENLRMSSRTAAIPVLLVTSSVAETSEGGFPNHFKADDFLRKPFKPEDLLFKVKRLVGTRSRFSERSTAAPARAT